MALADIPMLVKRCALAIYKKKYVRGTKRQRVLHSLNIARGQLVRYGYLQQGSDVGSTANIKLTGKGVRREAVHARKGDTGRKVAAWDALYVLIEGSDEDLGDGAVSGVAPIVAATAREGRDVQRRRRLGRVTRSAPRPRVKRSRRAKRG